MAGHKSIWSGTKKKNYLYPNSKQRDEEKNAAPSQWGRRLARCIGEKFGVQMVENHARNFGVFKGKSVIIKCAKSPKPPVSILESNLDRTDELWAVYLMPEGHADVWVIAIRDVRRCGYFTRGLNTQRRVELTLRKILSTGHLIGTLSEHEVEACRIP